MITRLRVSAAPAGLESREERQRFYQSRQWREHRRAFLLEHPLCVECQAMGRTVAAVAVDHKVAIAKGGDLWNWGNLQGLCWPHHSRKTRAEQRGAVYSRDIGADGNPVDKQHPFHK